MKKLLIFMVMAVLMSGCSILGQKEKMSDLDRMEMPTPYEDVESMDLAERKVGFSFQIPAKMSGAEKSKITVVDNMIIQVTYGNDAITLRKGKGQADISGDTAEYESVQKAIFNKNEIECKGKGDKYHLITWSSDDYSYSIRISDGADFESCLKMLEGIE